MRYSVGGIVLLTILSAAVLREVSGDDEFVYLEDEERIGYENLENNSQRPCAEHWDTEGRKTIECVSGKPRKLDGGRRTNWTNSEGCEVLSPEPSEVGKLYTTFSSPEESFVCEDSKGRQLLYSLDEELPTTLECAQRQVCTASAKCEYWNYVEMCEVERNSEVLLYQENCVAVDYIRRGGMDAEMNKEWLCQPQNKDLNTQKKEETVDRNETLEEACGRGTSNAKVDEFQLQKGLVFSVVLFLYLAVVN